MKRQRIKIIVQSSHAPACRAAIQSFIKGIYHFFMYVFFGFCLVFFLGFQLSDFVHVFREVYCAELNIATLMFVLKEKVGFGLGQFDETLFSLLENSSPVCYIVGICYEAEQCFRCRYV